jgi:hypothetical protein
MSVFLKSSPLKRIGSPVTLASAVGDAVAEIQPARVAALAEVEEGLAREMRLLDRERFDDDVGSAEKTSH